MFSVAVIIPCYNSSKYIKKTIDSVLCQDYEPLEIIVVDDGSTDETRKILECYSDSIKIYSHPNNTNLGQSASINLGISKSKSDLIAFLDSDDLWYPDKVKEQVNVFEKYLNIGLVYTNGYAIDENDNLLYKLFKDSYKESNKHCEILLDCYIRNPSGVMVRREIFEKTGLFIIGLQSMDHDMWIRMSEVTKFRYIPRFLMAYRIHPGQQSYKRRQWEDGFTILKEACRRYPYGLNTKRRRLAVLYYRLGEYDWRHGSYLNAIKCFLLAGFLDPLRSIKVLLLEKLL